MECHISAERRGGGHFRHDPVRRLLRSGLDAEAAAALLGLHGRYTAGAGRGVLRGRRGAAAGGGLAHCSYAARLCEKENKWKISSYPKTVSPGFA